uniref:Uncharacterized protein n=1 Tax=Phlebotomus papatasi TaxID=29031 RepID=A0A1B0DGS6_PHLPP
MCITFTSINVAFSIFVGKSENRFTEQEIESYTNAGSIAEEVFNSIRTVTAFGGAEMETKRYAENLKIAEKSGIKKSFYSGLQNGIMWFLSFLGWAFGMFLGIHFMAKELDLPDDMRTYNAISILTIVSSLIHNSQLLTLTIPSLDIISTARSVFKAVYQVIDQKSGLDPFSMDGIMLDENFKGNIRFDNVAFRYPSRPTVEVLKGVSFTLQTQQTIALVGHSGCVSVLNCVRKANHHWNAFSYIFSLNVYPFIASDIFYSNWNDC